jgi:beta-galactosidase
MPKVVRPSSKYPPVHPGLPALWHGGDYNPDQWLETPEIIDEDFRLFPLAGANVVSVGIFAWSRLEPEEGRYELGWLDDLLDRLARAGMKAILATPSGARPAWLSARYPEVLRVEANRVRNLHGGRHNHCPSSPVYREKVAALDRRLAERYGRHPALALWHVSNEFGGACHCGLCQDAFRAWLRGRHGDLDALNRAWWADFWSHRYTDWSQIESPAPHGETSVHGLTLDWRRFVTAQSLDFYLAEAAELRRAAPGVPVTTNLMWTYDGLDYSRWAPHLDVAAWDSYPDWHNDREALWETAARTAFAHDQIRALRGGQPFLLMESTPSQVNWHPVNGLKRPGVHRAASLQAVAHGADSVMYFQWRKSRGSAEKLHGAVVDHAGHPRTRTFREVAEVGAELAGLPAVVGTAVPAEAAVVFDTENRWALEDAQGMVRDRKDYQRTCELHHRALWRQGIPVDVVDMEQDLSRYRLVAAPMLYMVRPGVAARLEAFVRAGGTLVTTYASGYVDENDLCHLGGWPGPLRALVGVWAEELDALYPSQSNRALAVPGDALGLEGSYAIHTLCELVHPEDGAEVLATYQDDFYAGRPVLTRHRAGEGRAYHVAARTEPRFLDDLYRGLAREAALRRVLDAPLPEGVSAQVRTDGETEHVFLLNFGAEAQALQPGPGAGSLADAHDGRPVAFPLTLAPLEVRVLRRPARR